MRSDEIIFLERSEVIGREDCWREISIHYTPLYSKGKAKVRSCAPAEERSESRFTEGEGAKEAYLIIIQRGKGSKPILLISFKGQAKTYS